MVNKVYKRSFPYHNAYDTNACNLRYKNAYRSCYKMQCKCKHAQRKAIHMLQRSSHSQLKKSNTHQVPPTNEWKLLDLGPWWKYRLVVHVWVHGSKRFSFSTLALRKWYLASMCLVLEWSNGFFATLMALVLSHRSGTWVYSSPKSLMVYVIQRAESNNLLQQRTRFQL
jgi:hypothetical protein